MQIKIRVIPRARQSKIVAESDDSLRVYTNVAPTDGKANDAVVKMLAKYLDVPKTQIKIVRGETSHDKIIEY